MWTASNFSTYQRQFDFSSSEQGRPTYTTLKADDEVLINMVELFEGDDNSTFQFQICEHCGFTQCQPGNWLSIRQTENYILFIPAFDEILKEHELNEYTPPYFFNTKGALILTVNQFEDLKERVSAFRKLTDIKPLTGFEASSLYKWDTPHRMFGEFPNFKSLRVDHILCASELDEQTVISTILDKLNIIEKLKTVRLVSLDNKDIPITLFLEGKTTTEWKALCRTKNGMELMIGENYKLLTD
jgi:hypothetical protein